MLQAPDVALSQIAIGGVAVPVMVLLALAKIREHERLRRWLLGAGLAGMAAMLLWGLGGLPDFGHYRGPYGLVIAQVVVPQRHATALVTAVVFDYRGVRHVGRGDDPLRRVGRLRRAAARAARGARAGGA